MKWYIALHICLDHLVYVTSLRGVSFEPDFAQNSCKLLRLTSIDAGLLGLNALLSVLSDAPDAAVRGLWAGSTA